MSLKEQFQDYLLWLSAIIFFISPYISLLLGSILLINSQSVGGLLLCVYGLFIGGFFLYSPTSKPIQKDYHTSPTQFNRKV